jgi:cytochrome c
MNKMKKLLSLLFISAVIFSCGNDEGSKTDDTNKTADTSSPAQAPAAGGGTAIANEKGLELIGGSDCMACHAIDRKVIGPAYVEVAKRYENNQAVIDSLAGKIIKGGMGNWGPVMMTPHPNISEDDAKEMVKYILSLKNQQ